MKKFLSSLLVLCLISSFTVAQKLIINNSSCTDVNLVVYADDGSNCGPIAIDQSNTITVTSGGTSTVFDFNSTLAATGFTWVSNGTPGGASVTLAGNPFNLFKADVWTACSPGPSGSFFCQTWGDGVSVDNPNCNSAGANNTFEATFNYPCGSCCNCTLAPPIPTNCPANAMIKVDFSISGSDWVIDFYN